MAHPSCFASRRPSKIQRARCHSAALAKVPSTAPALRAAPWGAPRKSLVGRFRNEKKTRFRDTLPETDRIFPSEKLDGFQDETFFLGWPSFRCYVNFRECSWIEKLKMSEKNRLEFRHPQINMTPPKLVVCR